MIEGVCGDSCIVVVWTESGVTVTYTIRVRVTPGSNPGSPTFIFLVRIVVPGLWKWCI